jgi:hypothetical protein
MCITLTSKTCICYIYIEADGNPNQVRKTIQIQAPNIFLRKNIYITLTSNTCICYIYIEADGNPNQVQETIQIQATKLQLI